MLFCVGCQWHLSNNGDEESDGPISIERYDRLERHFLTSGDVAAMQQMNTEYPAETRTLIEDMLRLGRVDDQGINSRFLSFFQDSTLQVLIGDAEKQYADMSDLEEQLGSAFGRLQDFLPTLQMPRVYTQIGSLDQSIVVGDGLLGISLDKYLGSDHPVYLRYGYTDGQRAMMSREYIVPDCLSFYLLSLFPFNGEPATPENMARAAEHMARIQYVANKAMGRDFFTSEGVRAVEEYMSEHPSTTVSELLSLQDNEQ